MAVTTCLTWLQEKRLQNHFGGKQFSLLYKASVHEFYSKKLLEKCCNQGPTITVIHSENYVTGAYLLDSLQEEREVPVILFALKETEISEYKIGSHRLETLFYDMYSDPFGFVVDIKKPPAGFWIDLGNKRVAMSSKVSEELGLPQPCITSFQECEVFRCEDLFDKRKEEEVTVLKRTLLFAMSTYKPYKDMVHQIRILLLGPTGAGKSSFINSVKSIFRGHVTNQVLVGCDATGISKKYRTYPIKDGNDGQCLPFILCDSLGLSEKEGLCEEDIVSILKGHVPDRYQFNSMEPITSRHRNYIHSPSLQDRIHCVAFVFDANSVEQLSGEMVAKIKRIRREMIKYGVVHLALLTHVDSMDLITVGDFPDIYSCVPVKLKLETVHRKLGFALSDILVVSNYVSEWELNPVKDILILSALRQMLWAADDFLEDLPLE
ncbi:interferon induced protein 44 [Ictidomys tridecemlineatus]|uniref:Interferon-induced protein 44 n=1 Tax=Ictidomys tridecemlineatus TaxID=43179 RepID=I3ML54_ICTTR|nr:interferon-induced protein 44 [Ictidomys tridecemlineatus]KAG3283440.1 interferon induced protein 44 [Ictidomys tridecemlineatus]